MTGAAGFIGSHLCEALLKLNFEVIGIDDLSYGNLNNIKAIEKHPKFKLLIGKVDLLAEWHEHADMLIHLASKKIPRYDNAWNTIQENIKSAQTAVDFAIKSNCLLLFASTSDVYGKNPLTPYTEDSDLMLGASSVKRWAYAASKIAGEHLVIGAAAEFGFDYAILRFFGTYGPRHHLSWWGGPQSVFIEKLLANEPIEIHGNGKQIRSFIYIDDLVNGIIGAILNRKKSGIFNLCQKPESAISIIDLTTKIGAIMQPEKDIKLTFVPYSSFGNYEDVMKRTGSAQKANEEFGFEPQIELEEGLKKTIDWHLTIRNLS